LKEKYLLKQNNQPRLHWPATMMGRDFIVGSLKTDNQHVRAMEKYTRKNWVAGNCVSSIVQLEEKI